MTHELPANDIKPHKTDAMECECGATIDWEEHVVIHNAFDGREKRLKQCEQLVSVGADILGEISAVQKLLELDQAKKAAGRVVMMNYWTLMSKYYADGRFRKAREMFGPMRSIASAVLVEVDQHSRDKFLNQLFALGYVGWVNEMDERIDG